MGTTAFLDNGTRIEINCARLSPSLRVPDGYSVFLVADEDVVLSLVADEAASVAKWLDVVACASHYSFTPIYLAGAAPL